MKFLLTRSPHRRRGIALITVLAMVALLTVTVVAMLSMTESEKKSADIHMGGVMARLTAESAVAVAMGQLRNATSQEFSSGLPKPWASQPGAIRVHQMDGELEDLYKLYTAADMLVQDTSSLATDVPGDWSDRTAEFVDLNAPIGGENLRFPILDPRMEKADPELSVEGFHYGGADSPSGLVPPASGADQQRLPMPVRWMYMLRDGTLGVLDASSRFVSAGNSKPTRENPIVARFAFWVDDESCKINTNTAAEGAFWDTPRADTVQERKLAEIQPTRLEYQRHAGHPAGVCLSSVLMPNYRFHPEGFTSENRIELGPMNSMTLEDATDLWRLGRLMNAETDEGTSIGGTEYPELLELANVKPRYDVRQGPYASTDEMIFDNADLKNLPKTWSYRDTSGQRTRLLFFQRHPEALARLSQAHGVFTTHSSAPEVTLFGTPRIALWPVHATTPEPGQQPTEDVDGIGLRTTPYDSKVALIATLGGQRYFVQRSEPGSGENDLEAHADKQNKKIFDYLKRLTDAPFPGYNRPTAGYSTFKEKYAAGGNAQGTDSDRDAMVLSLLDYIRSSNFADGHLDTASQFSTLCKGIEHWGFGQVSPMRTRVTNSQLGTTDALTTFGRMITVSEVALTVVCVAEKMTDGSIRGLDDAANRRDLKNVGDRRLEVGFLVEGFVPGEGWTDYRPYASMSLEGGAPGVSPINGTKNWPAMRLNGIALSPETNSARVESTESQRSDWTGFGGTLGVRALTGGVLMFKPIVLPATSGPSLKFTGDSGGSNQLKLAIYDSPSAAGGGNSSLGELVQVIPLVFPDFELATLPTAPAAAEGVAYKLRPRVLEADSKLNKPLLRAGDVVQSLVPLHGDHRLIAARRWVQSQTGPAGIPLFVPHSSYGALAFAHSLQDPAIPETARPPAAANSLIPDITLAAKGSPDFPLSPVHSRSVYLFPGGWQSFSPNEALDRIRLDSGKRGGAWPHLTGDFDNGTGNGPDGAFLNRPDDGNWAAFKNHQTPYFTASKTSQTGASVPPVIIAGFSAQRILPSPVMFGSLPTGTRSNVPWQTLLFRPDLGGTHYGAKTPPDHLLLDLFWSPVLEPAPISTPLETAGKINVNHTLVPFSYIHRSTALHAAMKAETLLAIPDSAGERYKAGPTMTEKFRRYIDTAGTLEIWKRRVFDQNKVFLTPGEICEHPLVPEGIGSDDDDLQKFWSEHRLTGDNSKERPYAHLYPRLTTQSNVFRVHFIAETLTKARSTDPEEFDIRKDKITGRFRGSSVLIRHIDTPLAEIPDYLTDTSATNTNTQPTQRLHHLYNWSTSAMEEFR